MSAPRVSGTRLRCGTRTYRRSLITDGVARTIDEERSKAPSASSCTTSAFSPSTRHTARRRPTVVNGSYVTLSSKTRRTPASCPVCKPGVPVKPGVLAMNRVTGNDPPDITPV